MNCDNIYILKKEYETLIYEDCHYGYTLCYNDYNTRRFDSYIKNLHKIDHAEYYKKGEELGAIIVTNSVQNRHCVFKSFREAKVFLEWVQSRILLNKLC